MVSIKGSLTLVALAVGVVLFFGAGGFKGVGQKIGGFFGQGFSDFSSSISSAFTSGLFGGTINPNIGIQNIPQNIAKMADPVGFQRGILGALIDQVNKIFQQADAQISPPLTSGQLSSLQFAIQTSGGRPLSDFTVQPRQGSAVARTGQSFISNLGGRERAFGSQESLNSFIERFNR